MEGKGTRQRFKRSDEKTPTIYHFKRAANQQPINRIRYHTNNQQIFTIPHHQLLSLPHYRTIQVLSIGGNSSREPKLTQPRKLPRAQRTRLRKEQWLNVKHGDPEQHREAGHMATLVKKGNNSTNSQPNLTKQDDIN